MGRVPARTTVVSMVLAIVVLAALVVAAWLAVQLSLSLLREGGEVGNAVNILWPLAVAGIAYLYRQSREKRAQLEARLADHKRALYEGYVDVFKELTSASRSGDKVGTSEQIERLSTFAFRSLLIASDPVVKAHIRFTNVARITSEKTGGLAAVADVLLAIRQDMGLDTKLSARDLMGVFVKELDDPSIAAGFAVWSAAKPAWDQKMGWAKPNSR